MKRLMYSVAFSVVIVSVIGPDRLESFPEGMNRQELKQDWMPFVPGQVLVQYRRSVSEGYAALNVSNKKHSIMKSLPAMDRRKGPMAVVQLKGRASVEDAIKQFENDPDVEFAQPNYIYRASRAPNDASYGQLWGMKNTSQTVAGGTYATNNPPGYSGKDIGAELAWNVITDCSSTTVAVIDSGVNYNHEDLADNMVTGSYSCPGGTGVHGCDFVGAGDNDPMDFNGHGTHVAGTIGAAGNNGRGVAGVCWKASILAVRVLDAAGVGTTADIVEGLVFAAGTEAGQGNAKVVNMSLGGGTPDPAFSEAISAARTNGVIVVVAAGNEGRSNTSYSSYPCNYAHENILCVAAADQRYVRATFSNYGSSHVDIAAPGTNILSTFAGRNKEISYDSMSGWTQDTTAGTSWGMGSCNSSVLGGTYPMLLLPNECTTVLTGTSDAGYLADTDATIYKELNVPDGAEALTLTFVATVDVEGGYDYLAGYHSNAPGNPVSSGTMFTLLSGELNGQWGFFQYDLPECAGKPKCSVGFRVVSDYAVNRAGVGIATLGLSVFDYNITNVYLPENGTSMAAPHVAGVATMVRARNPNFTYTDTINAILKGGDTATSTLSTTYTKSGKTLNAFGALKYIPQTEGVTVTAP